MTDCRHITVDETRQRLAREPMTVVDIRDAASFNAGHIDGAILLDNRSIDGFLQTADRTRPVVVCCYHGISSQNAARFLQQEGFAEVYSMDGGYAAWAASAP